MRVRKTLFFLNGKGAEGKSSKAEEEEESHDDGKTPSFTVLLHGGLKMESMVAVARIQ